VWRGWTHRFPGDSTHRFSNFEEGLLVAGYSYNQVLDFVVRYDP
jgi:hypothetical protein